MIYGSITAIANEYIKDVQIIYRWIKKDIIKKLVFRYKKNIVSKEKKIIFYIHEKDLLNIQGKCYMCIDEFINND